MRISFDDTDYQKDFQQNNWCQVYTSLLEVKGHKSAVIYRKPDNLHTNTK